MAGGGVPSLLEFLDGSSLRMLNDYGDFGLDAEAGAMLIMQVDQSPTESEAAMETFAEVARRCGALDVAYSDDPTDSVALITARRMRSSRAPTGEVSCSTMCACRARPCPNSATD